MQLHKLHLTQKTKQKSHTSYEFDTNGVLYWILIHLNLLLLLQPFTFRGTQSHLPGFSQYQPQHFHSDLRGSPKMPHCAWPMML